jgi:hypothetical protein
MWKKVPVNYLKYFTGGNEESHDILSRNEVLTAVSTKMAVFWVVAPCRLVW